MALLVMLHRPYKLTLLVAGGCNLRCRICSIWQRKNAVITLEEVKELWSAFRIKPCWVNISGGEPTLNPELVRILEYFLSMRRPLLVTLTSNGQVELSTMLEHVLRANQKSIVYVSISLDGEQPEHDAVRGCPGAFARASHTLERLQALAGGAPALRVGVSTTLSPANLDSVLPFLARLRQVPVSVNLLQSSAYYGNALDDGFRSLPVDELVRTLRAIQYLQPRLSLASFLKVNFLESVIRYLKGGYTPLPCSSIEDNLLVTADLDVVDCTLHFHAWEPRREPRAARLEAIAEVIRSPAERRRALRQRVRELDCERTCHTPCEGYVHLVSAVLNPLWAPRLVGTYALRCAQSRVRGPRAVQRALNATQNGTPARGARLSVG
jgi:sulfatase maturation enzyme AslB (radical SAM superfamily)